MKNNWLIVFILGSIKIKKKLLALILLLSSFAFEPRVNSQQLSKEQDTSNANSLIYDSSQAIPALPLILCGEAFDNYNPERQALTELDKKFKELLSKLSLRKDQVKIDLTTNLAYNPNWLKNIETILICILVSSK